jgi:hypothetical protein
MGYSDGLRARGPTFDSKQCKVYLFSMRPDRLWDPASLLSNGYPGSFLGVKAAGA